MGRGNPNIKDIPHRGRKPKGSDPFYFIINDSIRISRDTYQYIISQRSIVKDTGIPYEIGVRFYSSLESLAKQGLPEFGISDPEINTFLNRVKGVTQVYKNGKMIVTLPEDIQFDKRDIKEEEEEEDDTPSDN